MRYPPTHKDETRQTVLRAAAAALREHGPNGVSVAGIMRSAGLTHGGFYAHFASKDDLVAQAVNEMFAQSDRRFARITEGLARDAALAAYLDRYLSAAHRDDLARGCPLTAIASDMARAPPTARAAFDAGVAAMVARLAAWLPVSEAPAAARAAAMIAEMAGAVALARAVSDPALSTEILAACLASARARAGLAN
jgi:TetR/AcrR family transcriptional repressor of nem operon